MMPDIDHYRAAVVREHAIAHRAYKHAILSGDVSCMEIAEAAIRLANLAQLLLAVAEGHESRIAALEEVTASE